MRRFIPEAWLAFSGGNDEGIVERFRGELHHPDPGVALSAARRWYDYEARMMLAGDMAADTGAPPADDLLARVRVQVHYLANECFLAPGELLANLGRIAALPAVIVQGRLDMVCPPLAAVEVARRLPRADLQLVPDAGHSGSHPAIALRLCAAAVRMQALLE